MSVAPQPSDAIKTAIFGGAFDPLHNGHLATVAALLSSGVVQQVIVVPSGDRPDKPHATRALQRLELCRLGVEEAFKGDSRVEVSDAHAAQRVGYGTIDLVRYFAADRSREIFVVIGMELLKDLPQWKEADELKAIAKFLAVQRPGGEISVAPAGWDVTSFKYPYDAGVYVSSTLLRRLLKHRSPCAGLMPATVERFCVQHDLY